MTGSLLETKLFAPRPQRGFVPRPRLAERIRRGAESAVTLVSAPAGFGKTTLLAELVAGARQPVAWVSVDRDDDDPARFWAHVAAAIDRAQPGVGARALAALDDLGRGHRPALTTLVNDLAASDDLILVLDDYHAIEAPAVHDDVAFLLDHLPPTLHLVIGTRADPSLPLARLRAQGRLSEIRAADLRFSTVEATTYLNGSMELTLSGPQVDALENRTEGWIAALQLAGLSIQGREDVAGFLAGFAGDDRYVVDYLAEEVLQRQPTDVRVFLLSTSILARMCGPLCDAVTGGEGGAQRLAALDRANLFLVPLDDTRRWYRYHHLFANVLEARLRDELPHEVPRLHRRASDWFDAAGDPTEAIRHAVAAREFERAADLIELATPAMLRRRREATVRGWMDGLPAETFESRPVLSIDYVGARMSDGSLEGVEPHLVRVERWLEAVEEADTRQGPRPAATIVDEDRARQLPRAIGMYRAAQALGRGDLEATATHARRALDTSSPDDHLGRGAARALLGLARWTAGDLDEAYSSFAQGMADLEQADHLPDVVGGAVTLADIRLVQGRLTDALGLYERGLALATRMPGEVLRGAADMHVGIASVLLERGDLDGAVAHLASSRDLGEANGLPKHPWRWRLIAAAVREEEDDLDGSLALIEAAEPVYDTDFSPDVRPIGAVKARVLVASGDLDAARAWAAERGLAPTDKVAYLREFEHLVLARLLLAEGTSRRSRSSIRDGIDLGERLRAAAEVGGRVGTEIEIGVVLALLHQANGEETRCVEALDRALVLGEHEGYARIFTGAGEGILPLLRLVGRQGQSAAYARRLLDGAVSPVRRTPATAGLVEPLSERELEVLRLLQGDLDGPEIARRLFVSVNTLRTHTKRIYAKLGVTSRRAAVRRATELGLLGR